MKEGIYSDISNQEYHDGRSHISSSGLKLMLKDGREFHKKYVLNEQEVHRNQSAMDFGTYIHTLILEPHLVQEEFAVFDGMMRKGKAWEKFKEEQEGKILLTRSQGSLAEGMINSFNESEFILGDHGAEEKVKLTSFFKKGKAEESFFTELEGVPVKVRSDYRKLTDEFASINDIKTTSESIRGIRDAVEICNRFDYDLSAALYVDVVKQLTGVEHDFFFTFLSKKDLGCSIFKASESFLERGREKYLEALHKLKRARETGVYFDNSIRELP